MDTHTVLGKARGTGEVLDFITGFPHMHRPASRAQRVPMTGTLEGADSIATETPGMGLLESQSHLLRKAGRCQGPAGEPLERRDGGSLQGGSAFKTRFENPFY